MRKWLDEEYEFEVEVTGYLRGGTRLKDSAVTERKSVISIPVLMAVL